MKTKKSILLIGDIIVLYASLAIALILRYKNFDFQIFQNHFSSFTIIFLLWVIVFYIHNLYDLDIAKNNLTFYSALLRSVLINAGIAIAYFYLIPHVVTTGITPKTNLFLVILSFIILFSIWRHLFNRIAGSGALNTAVIGSNSQAIKLAKEIQKNPQLGYRLKVIVVPKEEDKQKIKQRIENIEIKTGFKNLKDILIKKKINLAIISPEIYGSLDVIQNLFECLRNKIDFTSLSSFYEKFAKKIPISTISQVWFLENISQNHKNFYDFFKRIFDIIMTFVVLALTLLFWPIIALIVKLESPGSVFYKQIRIGQNGKQLKIVKFRSMVKDAEKDGPKMAQEKDERATKFGKFLRKTRLDELPQLWNVLKGEMSFVGPRAERPEFHEDLKKAVPFFTERYLIKPGLSGWAQIKHGYSSSINDNFEKIQYDLYYVKNRSFLLDFGIILKTINTILRGGGR